MIEFRFSYMEFLLYFTTVVLSSFFFGFAYCLIFFFKRVEVTEKSRVRFRAILKMARFVDGMGR